MLSSPVIKRKHNSDNQYILVVSYQLVKYWSESNGRHYTISVPSDFVFDGASIPRVFWRLAGHPMLPRYLAAAVVHDYLYGADLKETELQMTRKEVDLLFYDMLREDGVGWIKGNEMYYAVRMGGGFAFRGSNNKYGG